MDWTCDKCGLNLKVKRLPVRCECGAVGERPAPKMPSLVTMGVNFTKAATVHEVHGRPKSPYWEIAERQRICQACDEYDPQKQRCAVCGCKVNGQRVYLNKLSWADMRCPNDKWTSTTLRWYSTVELAKYAVELIDRLPSDTSRIVGVPRSGMLPAAAIATEMHVPLYSVVEGRLELLRGGQRSYDLPGGESGRTVVIDDSVGRGGQLHELRRIRELQTAFIAAVFVTPERQEAVDLFHTVVPSPHLFQWNFFNGPQVSMAALDMDGLLCPDATPEQYAGGDEFLATLKPLNIPRNRRFKAAAIITARCDTHRQVTQNWLAAYGAQYRELIMWPWAPEKRTLEKVAAWKAQCCREIDCAMYVESDPVMAEAIRANHTRVLCPSQGVMR